MLRRSPPERPTINLSGTLILRALLAIAVLLLVAVVAVVAIGSGEPEDGNLIADRTVDLGEVGGKGPGFDVETGSIAPGAAVEESEQRDPAMAATNAESDSSSPARTAGATEAVPGAGDRAVP